MSESRTYVVRNALTRANAVDAVRRLNPSDRIAYRITIEERDEPCTREQRGLIFALCEEVAKAVPFPGGGRADGESWYRFLIGLHRGERMVREGQVVVVIGGGLSGATKTEASELAAFVEAWGAERGVRFRSPQRYEGVV